MKKTSFILSFVVSVVGLSSARAATRFQFLPGGLNGMVFVKSGGFSGVEDSDFAQLFQFMDVPIQDSIVGKGKSIRTSERDFSLICGEYQTQCQVFLKKSPRVQILPEQKMMKFQASGDEADRLTEQFLRTGDHVMEFYTEDRKFHLLGEPGRFVFEAAEGGF